VFILASALGEIPSTPKIGKLSFDDDRDPNGIVLAQFSTFGATTSTSDLFCIQSIIEISRREKVVSVRVSSVMEGILGRGCLMRSPSVSVFVVPIVDEIIPYSEEKDVKATNPMIMTITGIIVRMKRRVRLLMVRLAIEKIMVIGMKRGRMKRVITKKLIDRLEVIRIDEGPTIWQPA